MVTDTLNLLFSQLRALEGLERVIYTGDMSDAINALIKAFEAKKARLLKEAAAAIDREMAAERAAIELLFQKYGAEASLATPESTFQHLMQSVENLPPRPPLPEVAPPQPPAIVAQGPAEPLTLNVLAELYKNGPAYRRLRYTARKTYDGMLYRIESERGNVRLADLDAAKLRGFYEGWAADGKLSLGHSMMTMMRGLFSFGTTELNDAECQRLSIILNKMRFPNPPPREEVLTLEHVRLIIDKAHEIKRPSLALAQALQFDFMIRQKDVIGEYVPVTEPGESTIVVDGLKWVHGIRWENIDDNLVLRFTSSFRDQPIAADLRKSKLVMEELRKLGKRPTSGPVIVSEWNNLPWAASEFRRWWRKCADAVGVPKKIRNMDSRSNSKMRSAGESAESNDDQKREPAMKEIRLH